MSDIERISFTDPGSKDKSGVQILPPDANKSFINFTPEGKEIRFGLLAIKNVGAWRSHARNNRGARATVDRNSKVLRIF